MRTAEGLADGSRVFLTSGKTTSLPAFDIDATIAASCWVKAGVGSRPLAVCFALPFDQVSNQSSPVIVSAWRLRKEVDQLINLALLWSRTVNDAAVPFAHTTGPDRKRSPANL